MKLLIGATIFVMLALWFLKRYKNSAGKGKGQTKGSKNKPKIDQNTKRIKFTFLTIDPDDPVPTNRWYQKSSWSNKNFFSYRGKWNSDWKWADEGKVRTVGLKQGNRTESFIRLAGYEDFKMYLEDEPDNPVDKNAKKVMASATVDGRPVSEQIGYLPKEIAEKYAGIELDIRPAKAFLPTKKGQTLGVEVALLVRSARYLKKQKNNDFLAIYPEAFQNLILRAK
jgi:hypothetical protein